MKNFVCGVKVKKRNFTKKDCFQGRSLKVLGLVIKGRNRLGKLFEPRVQNNREKIGYINLIPIRRFYGINPKICLYHTALSVQIR